MMQFRQRQPLDLSAVFPWKAPKQQQPQEEHTAPEDEPAAADDEAAKARDHKAHDSDNDTDDSGSSSADHPPPPATRATASSPAAPATETTPNKSLAARAGKLLFGRQISLPLRRRQSSAGPTNAHAHARSVSDFSVSDFAPLSPGTPVFTKYGLGTVLSHREDDEITAVALQGPTPVTLYMHASDDDYYALPALCHDWVETPAGEGRVVRFEPRTQTYRVCLGGDGKEVDAHRAAVRRLMPSRRLTTHPTTIAMATATTAPAPSAASPATESAIQKGWSSALKTLASTSSGLTNTAAYQRVANYCYYQGQCVITTFGPGQVVSLDHHHHRAQVQLTWGAMAYLDTAAVLHYTKALVGMEVHTKFGPGIVTELRAADAMYTVRLNQQPQQNEPSDGAASTEGVVYVHESDITPKPKNRLRLGSFGAGAPRQVKNTLASTGKLLSLAQGRLFGATAMAKAATTTKSPEVKESTTPPTAAQPASPPVAATTTTTETATASAPARTKSTRVAESDNEEPSSAGI